MSDLISVIVTTCNREDALDAVLRSLSRQSDDRFEVIVADDGSGPATAAMIESWKSRLGRPLSHVWHERNGFRAAEIRNRAILASSGRYCIFLDGDCLTRSDFVAIHRKLAEPGWFVAGNRMLLSEELTKTVLRANLAAETWSFPDFLRERLRGGVNRLVPLLRLPLGLLRKLRPQAWHDARSCNLAVWRTDLDRVDGFDADYVGWGREDSDLLVRLLRAGIRRKDGMFATAVLHLWHPAADRGALADNDRKFDDAREAGAIHARKGLSAFGAQA